MIRHIACAALAALLALSALGPAARADGYAASVYLESVRVFERAEKDAKEIDRLEQGAEVEVSALDEEWARIRYDGRRGYVPVYALRFAQGIPATVKESAWAYAAIPSNASIAGETKEKIALEQGAQVLLVGMKDAYFRVESPQGELLGYVEKALLQWEEEPDAPRQRNRKNALEELHAKAVSLMGKGYGINSVYSTDEYVMIGLGELTDEAIARVRSALSEYDEALYRFEEAEMARTV